jgi:hypothetical protein
MKNIASIVLGILALSFITVHAQSSLDKKVKDINGKVEKITIKTDKGEYVFEGDDAAKLAKRLKGKREVKKCYIMSDDDTVVVNMPDFPGCCPKFDKFFNDSTFKHFDIHIDADSIMKSIPKYFHKFFYGNSVTIITDEDGKETVETFTGEDADKKIDELKKSDENNGTKKKVIKKTVIIKKNDSKETTTDTK